MTSPLSKKRKDPPTPAAGSSKRQVKRAKTSKARTILTQTSDQALSQNGDLNVAAFVKAREFEIKALQKSMQDSSKVLSERAFQQVPREMRRRTASHNVKRVPKRLRPRAAKEMKEDNTPTVTSRKRKPTPHQRLRLEKAKELKKQGVTLKRKKDGLDVADGQAKACVEPQATSRIALPKSRKNKLSNPAKAPPRFRKRQVNKSWLPTHVWSAKRARMTEPMDPLWRFAIPLTPTEKCYRSTHRAGSWRGCVAWDASYMSTMCAEGTESSLLSLLRSIGLDEDLLTAQAGSRWRKGTRTWSGWIRERDGERRWLAPVTIIWCVKEEQGLSEGDDNAEGQKKKGKPRRKLFIRLHPSAFLAAWNEVLKVSKSQRPPVMIEDLRFELGSIEITGPGATEALVGILHPLQRTKSLLPKDTAALEAKSPAETSFDGGSSKTEDITDKYDHGDLFLKLASLTNPASLPQEAILDFDISDPRLRHPPQRTQQSPIDENYFLSILTDWPPDRASAPSSLFLRDSRIKASRLPSQKNINRRKSAADPGEYPTLLDSDPRIPCVLLISRSPRIENRANSVQGSWTLLLPWACVLPVWYSLVHYPLSSGGNPRFGGLEETKEISLDRQMAWFPGDYPGTCAGWAWELREREKQRKEWERKPKGKRCEWESLVLDEGRKGEIGIGWGCDWERLFTGVTTAPLDVRSSGGTNEKAAGTRDAEPKAMSDARQKDQVRQAQEDTVDTASPPATPPLSIQHIQRPFPSEIPVMSLAPVHITILTAGHPARNARIYKLPSNCAELRSRWMALNRKAGLPSRKRQTKSTAPGLKKSAVQDPRANREEADGDQSAVATSTAGSVIEIEKMTTEQRNKNSVQLARALLQPLLKPLSGVDQELLKPNHPLYPPVPPEEDLIGFVTSANYSLSSGSVTAIGNIAVARVSTNTEEANKDKNNVNSMKGHGDNTEGGEGRKSTASSARIVDPTEQRNLCIVRNAGESIGRLARWRFL